MPVIAADSRDMATEAIAPLDNYDFAVRVEPSSKRLLENDNNWDRRR